MDRQTLFFLIVGLAIVNGIFSPFLALSWRLALVLMPELFPPTQEWALFWGSILLSSGTLLFSGVPAALYERLVERDSTAAAWIWLAGALVLTFPVISRAL